MGVYLAVDDYDRDFANLKEVPAVLNDFYRDEFSGINPVKSIMVTEYEGDYIQTVPTCTCGKTMGRPNYGVICPACNTEVISPIERGFVTDVWVEVPEGVEAFILPNFFAMLDKAFVKNQFNAFRYLCDSHYKVEDKAQGIRERFDAIGIKRGYNNFIQNFEEIFTEIMSRPLFREKRAANEERLAFYHKFGKALFPHFLPMPSKRSVITELSGKGRKVANGYKHLLDGASLIFDACSPNLTVKRREYQVFKALSLFRDYGNFVDKEILGSKEGWYRKHVFGSRMGPTFRAVISSLAGVHQYDELHLPFGVGVATFRPQLMNKLLRRGYTVNQAEKLLISSISAKGDQTGTLVMDLLNELIEECPLKGLPVLFGRQPTLNLRSIQLLYVTKFKPDAADCTISLSLLILKGPNADFDGDQMQGMYIISRVDWNKARKLSPSTGIRDLNAPNALNKNLVLPDTVFSILNNFMYGRKE